MASPCPNTMGYVVPTWYFLSGRPSFDSVRRFCDVPRVLRIIVFHSILLRSGMVAQILLHFRRIRLVRLGLLLYLESEKVPLSEIDELVPRIRESC